MPAYELYLENLSQRFFDEGKLGNMPKEMHLIIDGSRTLVDMKQY